MNEDMQKLVEVKVNLASRISSMTAIIDATQRLEKMADEALKQYGEEMLGGGDPIFPQWAQDIRTVLEALK